MTNTQKPLVDYYRTPKSPNIDNMCIIRGTPTVDDFSDYYRIRGDETTVLTLELKVRNKAFRTYDLVMVTVYGHVPNEAIPKFKNGGMAEQMLKRLSSKCSITLYCHASYRQYIDKNGNKRKIQMLICDSYRTESRTSRMQAIMEENEKKKQLEQKYSE